MLICKPRDRKLVLDGKDGICLRSLRPRKDAWWLTASGNKEEWIQVYQSIMTSADAHAWAAISDGGLIGQLDSYSIVAGELGKYFKASANDAVLQYRFQSGVTKAAIHREILLRFTQYHFDNHNAGLLYAQGDIYDGRACRLYESAGFIFRQNIMLTSHAASLYLMTRERFNEQCKKI